MFYGLSDQDAQHRCSGFRGIKVFSNVLGSMDQRVQQYSGFPASVGSKRVKQ